MVQRNSEVFKIDTGNAVTQQQSGMGYATPDANEFSKGSTIQNFNASGPDILLNSILGAAKQVFDAGVQRDRTEAYLDGAAKAGLGQSEADLSQNIFTKDWAHAGFRDTMGRLAMADTNSRIAADMPTLREQPPEKFGEYLVERRQKLLPSMEGMSQDARKGMISSMVMDERAAIKQHSAEHYKFVWEQKQKGINAQTDEKVRALDRAKIESPGVDSTAAYTAATQAAFATAHSVLFLDPSVPKEARPQMLKGLVQQALANNHQALYNELRNTVVTMPDGVSRTMLSELDPDDQATLATQYRQSVERTSGLRAFGWGMEMVRQQAEWEDTTKPLPSHDSVVSQLKTAYDQGMYGEGPSANAKVEGDYKKYLDVAAKRNKTEPGIPMYLTGDVVGLAKSGLTQMEATEAWIKTTPLKGPDLVKALVVHGGRTGMEAPLKKAAELSQPAWAQLMTSKEMNPDNAKVIADTLVALESLPPGHRHAYLESFKDDETRDMALLTMENLKAMGGNGEAAIQKARAVLLEGKTGAPMSSAQRTQRASEDAKSMAELQPEGLISQGKTLVSSLWSADSRADRTLTAAVGVFENPAVAAESHQTSVAAVAEELSYITRSKPHLNAESRMTLAKTNVAARAAKTKWGAVIAPRGHTLESYFGVKDRDRVGAVLEQLVQPKTPDGRIAFRMGANNELMFEEFRKDGTSVNHGTIPPQAVKARAADNLEAEAKRYNQVHGAGVVHEAKIGDTKFPVKYNGRNAIGVAEDWMFDLRARLVKHEGVQDKPYEDAGGQINTATGKKVQTVGVGISDTNTFYPKNIVGSITPEQASESLRGASEEAAKIGARWLGVARLSRNKDAFQLLTEMAYQGGGSNNSTIAVVEAMRNRDIPGAVKALYASKPYKFAHPERRKYYEATLLSALKE